MSEAADFWEQRYAGSEPIWSGRVNQSLAELVADFEPGRALDLGCGEGADVIWLAEQGWKVTGVDISVTAIARAREAASEKAEDGQTDFVVADLESWVSESTDKYDLIIASFLQSPIGFDRSRVLRLAINLLADHGSMLLISHAAPPPWMKNHRPANHFIQPDQELEMLQLDPEGWKVQVAEVRERTITGPEGNKAILKDTVVLVQRLELDRV